jgi:hypothetical protein
VNSSSIRHHLARSLSFAAAKARKTPDRAMPSSSHCLAVLVSLVLIDRTSARRTLRSAHSIRRTAHPVAWDMAAAAPEHVPSGPRRSELQRQEAADRLSHRRRRTVVRETGVRSQQYLGVCVAQGRVRGGLQSSWGQFICRVAPQISVFNMKVGCSSNLPLVLFLIAFDDLTARRWSIP